MRPTFQPWKWLLVLASTLVACEGASRGAGPTTLTLHEVSGEGQSGIAGRALDRPLVIEVRDDGGRPVPGVTIGWSASGGSIDPAQVVTDAAGRASVTWMLGRAVGEMEATATIDNGARLTFRASAGSAIAAAAELVSAGEVEGLAGMAIAEPLEVRVLDGLGAPVEGVRVVWSVTAGGGTVLPATALTDATGTARGSWTLGSLVGWQTVEARAATLPVLAVRALTRQTVGAEGGTVVDVDGVVRLQIPAGALSTEQGLLVLRAPDATDSDLVAGTAHEFSPSGLDFAMPAALSIAVNSTEAQEAVASNRLAIHRLGDGGWAELMGSGPTSAGVAVTAPLNGFGVYGVLARRAVAAIEVTPPNASVVVIGTVTSFGVVLRDASGNLLDAAARRIEWSSDQASVAAVDASGRVTAVGDGKAKITARVGSVSGSATFNVEQTPGALTLTKAAGDAQTATVASAVAVAPRVLLQDASGKPIVGVSVTFAVASGGGSVAGASPTTNVTGHASVGSWALGNTPGANTLTATTAGVGSTTFTANAVAGPAARLVLATAPSDTAMIGVPLPTQPVLRLQDALGNVVAQAGVAVTAEVTAGGGTVSGTSTVSTSATGTASYTNLSLIGASGAQTVSFHAPGLTGVTAPVHVLGAPTATDDAVSGASAPGDPLHTALNTPLTVAAGTGALIANDALSGGAAITHFGAIQVNDGAGTLGAASGTVTSNAAGSSTAFGTGGSLRVNADGSFTFTPPTNYTGLFRFQYRLANAGGTDDATVTLAVGVRPEAVADSFSVLGNVPISVPGTSGLHANDRGDRLSYVSTSHTSGTAGTLGVTIGTGAVSYTPSAGHEGTDVYTYTVRNGFGSSQATLTLTTSGMIWFIDANATIAGNGRLTSPFRTLAEFNAAGGGAAGDAIFLYESATTYTGGLTLRSNQRLIGQDATASLASAAGVTVPPHAATLPTMNPGAGAATVMGGAGGGVQLASGNRLQGVRIDVSSGTGLQGTSYGTLVVRDASVESDAAAIALNNGVLDVQLTSTTSRGGTTGVSISSSAGSIALGSGSIGGATSAGLHLNAGSANITYAGTIANTVGRAVYVENGTGGSATLSGAIDASAGGILVQQDSRVVTFSGNVTVSNPTGVGIRVDRGIIRVAGQTTITGPGGIGIDIDAPRGKLSFGNVTISGRSVTGIDISTATDSITFGAVVMNNPNSSTARPVSVTNASRVILTGAHDIDLNNAGTSSHDGVYLQSSTVEIDGGTIRNAGGRGLSVDLANLRLRNFTLSGTVSRGVNMSAGQLDIANSTFENIGSNAIFMVANALEHRVRIVNSTIGETLSAVTNGYALDTFAPVVSIVLDNVTFGPREDGSVRALPVANVGSGVCVALRNLVPAAPLKNPEYVFDGTSGMVRFEEPKVGVIGTVSKTNVTDVAAGTCPLPSF